MLFRAADLVDVPPAEAAEEALLEALERARSRLEAGRGHQEVGLALADPLLLELEGVRAGPDGQDGFDGVPGLLEGLARRGLAGRLAVVQTSARCDPHPLLGCDLDLHEQDLTLRCDEQRSRREP